jgi:CheY-like chemotaxis protein
MDVLVVDDNRELAEALKLLFEGRGYPAVTAADGAQALEYLRGHPTPSLIILDLMMPVLDGWAFRRAQLADPRLASIPVVVCTAAGRTDGPDFAGAAGVYLKPVEWECLLRHARECCSPAAPAVPPPRPA